MTRTRPDILPVSSHAREMDIAFGTDGEYAPHLAATIASILRHSPQSRFRFIILFHDVPPASRARIEVYAPHVRFHWIEIQEKDVPPLRDNRPNRGHFSRAILFRLGLEQLAPQDCRRVLYLDSDIIVTADIEKLWRADLSGRPLGAVLDANADSLSKDFARRWSLPEDAGAYFNSGVLLIDLEQVRANRLFTAAIAFAAKEAHSVRFVDQEALNCVFWGKWHPIDVNWNVQRTTALAALSSRLLRHKSLDDRLPAIVHFTDPDKPWRTDGYHPWAWLYWQHLSRTPFFNDVAQKYGVTWYWRLRLWLRWLRRRPRLMSTSC
jgi:lipopolysaccharide biosynthesis glycosyltransferase